METPVNVVYYKGPRILTFNEDGVNLEKKKQMRGDSFKLTVILKINFKSQ